MVEYDYSCEGSGYSGRYGYFFFYLAMVEIVRIWLNIYKKKKEKKMKEHFIPHQLSMKGEGVLSPI